MRRIAAVLLGMLLLGTVAGVACWPETVAQTAVRRTAPQPDINAAIVLVRNFSGDTVPLFLVTATHEYAPLGLILPHSSGILVLPSVELLGLSSIAIFFVVDGEPVPGGVMERVPDHVSLMQFVVGDPDKEI